MTLQSRQRKQISRWLHNLLAFLTGQHKIYNRPRFSSNLFAIRSIATATVTVIPSKLYPALALLGITVPALAPWVPKRIELARLLFRLIPFRHFLEDFLGLRVRAGDRGAGISMYFCNERAVGRLALLNMPPVGAPHA